MFGTISVLEHLRTLLMVKILNFLKPCFLIVCLLRERHFNLFFNIYSFISI